VQWDTLPFTKPTPAQHNTLLDDDVKVPKHVGISGAYLCYTYCVVQVLALKRKFDSYFKKWACWSAVGWSIAIQAGRSRVWFLMVSLEFFIDNPLGRTMALSSHRSEYQEYFLGSKGSRYIGLTILPPSWVMVLKSEGINPLEPSGPVQACAVCFTFTLF
jgi:hypothetical protein